MNNKIRAVMSLCAIVLYFIMSMACLSESGRTTDDCDFLPSTISKKQNLKMKFLDSKTKLPIPNVLCSITTTFSKKEPNGINCIFTEFSNAYGVNGNANGQAEVDFVNEYESDDDYLVYIIHTAVENYFSQPAGGQFIFSESTKSIDILITEYSENP